MSFQELNNKEWVFIYTYLSEIKNHYDKILDDHGIEHVIKGPMGNTFSFFQNFSEEVLEKIYNSGKYKHLEGILNKIDPIYDIIKDSDPDMVNEVYHDVMDSKVDELLTEDLDDYDDQDEIM